MRNERRQVTTNSTDIQRIIRDYKQTNVHQNMPDLENMDKSLEMYNLPRLNQGEKKVAKMNRLNTSNEIKSVIKGPANKGLR